MVYILLIAVIVPLLFFMCALPLYVDSRIAREQRRSLSAPAVKDRSLPQAAIDEHTDNADGGERLSHHDDEIPLGNPLPVA